MKDFFISYNRQDKQWAEWIAWTLEEAGYTVVVELWDFRPGGNFVQYMNRAVQEARQTVAVLSQHFLEANYTQSEWSAGFAEDPQGLQRTLIPVRVGECSPAGLLKQLVYVDLVGVVEAEARQRLLDGLKERAKPDQKPSFPGAVPLQAERVEPEPVAFPGVVAPVQTPAELTVPEPVDAAELLPKPDEPIDAPKFFGLTRRQLLGLLVLSHGGTVVGTLGLERFFGSAAAKLPLSSRAVLRLYPFNFTVVTVNAKGEPTQTVNQAASQFQEDLGKGVGLVMVSLPDGQFFMGSPSGEGGADEHPQHLVSVSPFFMGKYPVTQAQWQVVATLPKVNRDLAADPSKFKGANRPVEQVSWEESVEFCDRLSRRTGRVYRLPTEAEWEYACRAGTATPFYFGETITTDLANNAGVDGTAGGKDVPGSYGTGSKGIYRQQTTDVSSFPPNNFGLYDLHGNVWEWCLDHWHDNYQGAPIDGSAWTEGGNPERRVLRGGSWFSYPRICRSASRFSFPLDNRSNNIGFRVVCAAPETL